jgi:hypothetical protein
MDFVYEAPSQTWIRLSYGQERRTSQSNIVGQATVEVRALNSEDITGSLRYISGMKVLIGPHVAKCLYRGRV